jgi:GntR family transcriptional repressor for pyruvate dehydrogenase complex
VSSRIKEAIVDGTLKPGDRLPPETELAARFDVSRQTIREALRMLEHTGLVDTPKRGAAGGTVVRNTIPETISGLFVDALRMDSISVDELNDARGRIEAMIVDLAVQRADDEDIRLLSENVIESRGQIDAGFMSTDNDLAFHLLVARACKNRVIDLVADAILCVIKVILARNPPTLLMSVESVEYHERFVEALKRRDVDTARSEMLSHLHAVHDDIRKNSSAYEIGS